MKALVVLTLLPLSLAKGALLANLVTDKGTIVVELQYAKTPKTVANFITMAQATRARLDPLSGEVVNKPLYIGEKFFRVENTATFKIIQTGSGNGTNTGTPGFIFRDEFDPTLTHVPYVLSMANSGQNTNGSQIYLTGDLTLSSLNNSYTVFGLVNDLPSHAVIDAILAAGANATTITNLTFDRTDGAALAFNELAQSLPEVSPAPFTLAVVPGSSVKALLEPPLVPWTELRLFKSSDLGTWAFAGSLHIGGSSDEVDGVVLTNSPPPKAFYRLIKTRYPDDQTISSMGSSTLSVQTTKGSFVYAFNAQGTGGTLTATLTGKPTTSGPFTLSSLASQPYKLVMVMDNQTSTTPQYMRITANSDQFASGQSSGRVNVEEVQSPFWVPYASGTQTITH